MSRTDKPLLRHILKTITYRILGTCVTVITAYGFGASLKVSSLLGLSELLIKPFIYFIHERAWFKFGNFK